jgi:hypothetical protein
MGKVCVFSHNTSFGGRRQKTISALNSAWIRGEAKLLIVLPCWAVLGLFVAFWVVLGHFMLFFN